jgi:phosphoglycerate dehydrogenase-like enzyme
VIGLPDASMGGLASLVRMAPDLRWVQGAAAGTGEVVARAGLTAQELDRVAITSGAGLYSAPLAEWAILGLLTFAKDVPRLIADRAAGRWQQQAVGTLAGRRLLVIGLGDIGRETARLASAFGMAVTGVRRNPVEPPAGVERMAPIEALPELMAGADAVVLALPATAETTGLLSRALIAELPAHASVVNVGRGATIDEPALIEALREGRLAGAALDVTAVEPLPAGSELWTLPNVLLSPHSAAVIAGRPPKLLELTVDNLRRYVTGEPLRNVVDTVRFY